MIFPLLMLACDQPAVHAADPPADPNTAQPAVTQPAPIQPEEATSADWLRIVFAGNFDDSGPCRKKALTGCDIYMAEYDLSQDTVRSVSVLAGRKGVAEDFPVVDPQGRYVLYQEEEERGHTLKYVIPQTLQQGVIAKRAREVALSMEGDMVGYTMEKPRRTFEVILRTVQVIDGVPQLGPVTRMTSNDRSTEPYFFPGGNEVAFYQKGQAPRTGQTRIHNRTTGEDVAFSNPDGCAHGSISPSGTRMLCQRHGRMFTRERASVTDSWGSLQERPFPEISDPDFPDGCTGITKGHPEFCASDDLLMVTYSCAKEQTLLSAQLMLFTWEGEVASLLTRRVADTIGHTGEARSGVCTRL
ncbi:MAG: hypothetical protein P8R54_14225 [Myxococcota bacterium]|nr:hypothetical protein [Myxococcota bacterium]